MKPVLRKVVGGLFHVTIKLFHIFSWNSLRKIFKTTCQEIPSVLFFIYSWLEEAVLYLGETGGEKAQYGTATLTSALATDSYNSVWWGSIEDVTVLWHNADISVQEVLK
jgi:hypothetical protein